MTQKLVSVGFSGCSLTANGLTPTRSSFVCYEYPYQWSNTDEKINHWCLILPIDEQTTRVFFLFYFDPLIIPMAGIRIPQWLMALVLKIANPLLIKPLLNQDGIAVEAEQKGYYNHFDAPIIELSPAVHLFQQLLKG